MLHPKVMASRPPRAATFELPPFCDAGHGYDEFGFHPPTLATALSATDLLYHRYFRVVSSGIESVPAVGAAILVANHGGVLPLDAALLCLDVMHRSDPPRVPRAMIDHFAARMPVVSAWFARLGVVSGTRANARRLLTRGELLAIWPEGVTGPAKPFRDRYRLQTWRVGFAELAIVHQVPIVPVAIVGAEESWPLLAKLPLHAMGIPYLPIPASPLPLPARIFIRYGAPIAPPAGDPRDPAVVGSLAERARDQVAAMLGSTLAQRRGVFA